jgi:hypothetical protein
MVAWGSHFMPAGHACGPKETKNVVLALPAANSNGLVPTIPQSGIPAIPTSNEHACFVAPIGPPAQNPQTIDQIIAQITQLKAQQEELAKQQKTLMDALKKKLTEQKEQLRKLKIEEDPPVPQPSCMTGGIRTAG